MSYQLPKNEIVEIKIFDILDKLIKTFVMLDQTSGNRFIIIQAENFRLAKKR